MLRSQAAEHVLPLHDFPTVELLNPFLHETANPVALGDPVDLLMLEKAKRCADDFTRGLIAS